MQLNKLDVYFDNGRSTRLVGQLASYNRSVVFEYDAAWCGGGLELSPYKLPLSQQAHNLSDSGIYGIFGLFADSLPDGWGMLLMDRSFLRRGVTRSQITPLDRLAFLGNHAMGALCYRPPLANDDAVDAVLIGDMAREAFDIFEGRIEEAGPLLTKIGGSPGGARPKALIGISDNGKRFVSGSGTLPNGYSHWLIKFATAKKHEGVLEFIYNEMAERAGINVPERRLVTDDSGARHIATRRFDRTPGNGRRHIATASGILHASHLAPTLDYSDLLKLAWQLTGDSIQVEEQFRRAVFNYYALNLDDHAKNHGYIMLDDGRWSLSPAYDLTYSTGPHEHCTSYLGKGAELSENDLASLAAKGAIDNSAAVRIIEQVKDSVAMFKRLAANHGLPAKVTSPIAKELDSLILHYH